MAKYDEQVLLRFMSLNLAGCEITDLFIRGNAKCALGLSIADAANKKAAQCELAFVRMRTHSIKIDNDLWLGIIVNYDAEIYEGKEGTEGDNGDENGISGLYSFRIMLDNGEIDIVSEDFVFSILQEVEYVESAKSG